MKQLFKSSNGFSSREMDFTELLEVNGGYSGSSGGSSSPSYSGGGGGYSSSSTGGNAASSSPRYVNSYSEAYSNSSSGNQRYQIKYINGKAYSSLTGYIPKYPEITPKTKEETKPETTIDISKLPDEFTPLETDALSGIAGIPDFVKKAVGSDTLLASKIIARINQDLNNKEVVYGKDGYMCDNFVQKVLSDCGVSWNSYFKGEAAKYTVREHIDNLDKNGNYDGSIVEKGNTYVVFMEGPKVLSNGKQVNYDPHCALLTVSADGTYYMIDNSSSNKTKTNLAGGVGYECGRSLSEIQSKFAYSKFYYQKAK